MDESSQSPPTKQRGSWWLACMGVAIAALGMLFVLMLWTAWQRAEETRRWNVVPAKVLSSQVHAEQDTPSSPTKYRIVVRYEYAVNGKAFVSERIRRVDGAKSDRDDAEAIREEFTPGQMITCFVKPDEPSFAIVRHDTRAAIYTIWFPLLFVIGGLRMAWGALRRNCATDQTHERS